MIPSKFFSSLEEALPKEIYTYKMTSAASKLVEQDFLSLISLEKLTLTLVTENAASDHQDIIGIAQNWLYLSLTDKTYRKSGLLGRQIYSKHLIKFDLKDPISVQQNSQFQKLMWFLNNVLTDEFDFVFSVSDGVNQKRLALNLLNELNIVEVPLVRKVSTLNHIKTPLQTTEPSDHEILEWVGMVSLEANQLLQEVDPYISQYGDSCSFSEERCDLTKITWTNGLVSTETFKNLWSLVSQRKLDWSIIVQHGVPDCVVDYGASPHCFYDNGENVDVVLQKGDSFCMWEVIGGKSGH